MLNTTPHPNFKGLTNISSFDAYSNSRKMLVLVFMFCSFLWASTSTAQVTDTTAKPIAKTETNQAHSPKKAAIMSALLPGLGQGYNKKYWKIPVIYAGFAGLAYSFNLNQTKFVRYRDAYKYRIDGDAATIDNYVGIYRDEDLNVLQKAYNRYRDLTVIGVALLYVLNVVDATVDAHLFTFNVSDDLTFNIRPTLINTAYNNQYQTGISVNIQL